jgi:hypothetical protein
LQEKNGLLQPGQQPVLEQVCRLDPVPLLLAGQDFLIYNLNVTVQHPCPHVDMIAEPAE